MRVVILLQLASVALSAVGPDHMTKVPSGSAISLDSGKISTDPNTMDIAFGVPDMMGDDWSDYCDHVDCDSGAHNAISDQVVKFIHGAAEYDITKFHSIQAGDLHGDSSFATTYVDGSKKTELDVFYCTRDKKGYLFKVKFLRHSNDDRQLIHYEGRL
jgi:hypothetical protein